MVVLVEFCGQTQLANHLVDIGNHTAHELIEVSIIFARRHTILISSGISDRVLHHVGVSRHIREEHEGETTCENTRTSTYLQ